ncbi:20914_t:CDS:2, partial [Racocetra persica]
DNTDAVPESPERMSVCNYYRNLWWDKGEFNEKVRWDEVTLPYVLATGITLEDYEELVIGAVTRMLLYQCNAVAFTNAEIYSFGTRDENRGKEADCIIVKIDPALQGQVPVRMRAWHYCIEDRRTRNTIPYKTSFEFGTQDGTGAPLSILQGQCIINISLRCLYHDLKPPARIPQNLNDPIQLDFYFAQHAIIQAYNIH